MSSATFSNIFIPRDRRVASPPPDDAGPPSAGSMVEPRGGDADELGILSTSEEMWLLIVRQIRSEGGAFAAVAE
eukprot:gene7349-6905_t